MESAETRLFGQPRQGRHLFGRLDQAAGRRDLVGLAFSNGSSVGFAAPAGPEARGLGFGRGCVEAHVLRIGKTGGA